MPPPKPVTPDMFAGLVADLRDDLAEASRLDAEDGGTRHDSLLVRQQPGKPRPPEPRSFEGRPWASQRVTLREAAELTGLAYHSLRVYRTQGDKDRAGKKEDHRSFPAGTKRGWKIGDLALWRATSRTQKTTTRPVRTGGEGTRWPAWDTYLPAVEKYAASLDGRRPSVTAAAEALGTERALARKLLRHTGVLPPRVTDADALAFLRGLVETSGRRTTLCDILDHLDDAGLRMGRIRAIRLWHQAGGRDPLEGPMNGPDLAGPESLRYDGLLTQTEVARWFDVSGALVFKARQPREDGPPLIVPAKWENGKPLYDPATLTHRKDMLIGPVRKGHPLAAELGTHHQLRRGIADGHQVVPPRRHPVRHHRTPRVAPPHRRRVRHPELDDRRQPVHPPTAPRRP